MTTNAIVRINATSVEAMALKEQSEERSETGGGDYEDEGSNMEGDGYLMATRVASDRGGSVDPISSCGQ